MVGSRPVDDNEPMSDGLGSLELLAFLTDSEPEALAAIEAGFEEWLRYGVEQARVLQRQVEAAEGIRNRDVFPVVWRPMNLDRLLSDPKVLAEVILDDGIPLMWVPRPTIADEILAALNSEARERVIVDHCREILTDCERILGALDDPWLTDQAGFLQRAITAVQDEHIEAGQALAVNVLDTTLRAVRAGSYKDLTRNNVDSHFEFHNHGLLAALTLAPVWRAHERFFPSAGARIPAKLNRHATVHAVSAQQYTRVNAVVAVMMGTTLFKCSSLLRWRPGS